MTRSLGHLLVAALLVVSNTSCGPTKPPPEDAGVGVDDAGFVEFVPTTNAEHRQMLQQLGFATEVGPRVGPKGETLPPQWHPLRKHHAAFYPRHEIYVAGGPVLDSQPEQFFDDKAQSFAKLPLTRHPDQTWIQAQYKNGIAIDVDDDGLDEFFIVYFAPGSGTLKYLLLDPNDATTAVTGVLDVAASSTGLDPFAQPSLAVGDLDRDGRPDLAIGFGKLYRLTKFRDGQFEVATRTFIDRNDVGVAIGSIDRDPFDELVVTHTETVSTTIKGFYEIFDGNLEEPFEAGELRVTDATNADHLFADTRVAIGNVDDDRIDDIVFHGRRVSPAGDAWHLFLMRYAETTPTPSDKHFSFRTMLHYTGLAYPTSPRVLVLPDLDGNGVREMYGSGDVVELGTDGKSKVRFTGVPTNMTRAVVANVDADTRDDLLVAGTGVLSIYGLDALDVWGRKSDFRSAGSAIDSPVLITGNTDRDSAIVRFDGEYELLFSDPQLITVMASPPWQDGIGQDVDSTTATFGKTQGSTVLSGQSLGVSVGFSVGFEYESDLFQTGVSAKQTFEAAFDVYANESRSVETSVSYTTAPGKDKVIFTTVPFDVYYYTIVSSPRASEVGKVVTVNLPRKPQSLGTSLEFYNSHNGGGLDVDARILKHTPGNVWSYPTVDDRVRLLSAAERDTPGYQQLWNGPIQVDESGSNGLELSTTQGSARGASMDFSTTTEFEVKAGGATAGGSVGFHYGMTTEVSTEQTSVFQGTVGAISGSAYAQNSYCYGLMVYPQLLAGQRFVVQNWWTQKQCATR